MPCRIQLKLYDSDGRRVDTESVILPANVSSYTANDWLQELIDLLDKKCHD